MIALLLIVVLIAILAEAKSLQRSVDEVQYHMEPSVKSVEQEEEFLLRTIIENHSRFNIPYLFVEEVIPDEVDLLDSNRMELEHEKGFYFHHSVLFMKKRQRVKRNIRSVAHKRGVVRFNYAKLKIGDFLGIKELTKKVDFSQSVVVYPIRLQDERLERVLSDVMGEISINSFLYEDPILIKGYRDYTGREPLRAISFPMSAKRNQLTVREFDHTREIMVDLIFDVSYKGDFDNYFIQQEALFALTRSVCEEFEQKKIGYRLITNAYYATMEVHGVNVIQSGGSGGSSITKILEVLGMASNASMCDTAELLSHAFRSFSQKKSFVYICHRREEENEALLTRLKRQYGVKIHCVYGEDFEEVYKEALHKKEA